MKKTLYFLLLFICALVIGGIIGSVASGSFAWLGLSRGFDFNPGTFINTEAFSLTFGISLHVSVAQVIFILIAIGTYIKTVGAVAGGGKS